MKPTPVVGWQGLQQHRPPGTAQPCRGAIKLLEFRLHSIEFSNTRTSMLPHCAGGRLTGWQLLGSTLCMQVEHCTEIAR